MADIVKQIHLTNENAEEPHDIEAKQLNPISSIGADNPDLSDEENTTLVFINGTNRGRIKLNTKGNISIESDNKHVNIEATKGIQMKPTTNITFDSSRRIDADKGNEVHLEFRDDDHDDRPSEDEYAKVYLEGRAHDIRCYEHGGIALQIAGHDGNHNENKIKFESDRTSEINETGTYTGEGGKGVEFGTFNNLHSSLYTGDYRFKADAPIMPCTRSEITTQSGGKKDYNTQEDDFKDIPLSYKLTGTNVDIKPCEWDDETGWTPGEGYAKLEVTLKELVLLVSVIKSGEADTYDKLKEILTSATSE